ncbi:MAG: bifunctional diaminohydroxyphosphoribosylaminopyrimidine deaminase/5-amino-6-(5-phosphoribosylamino)uracil reductase RibD [bacterium]|nr:bifunctional diaminohydroxyphosphoribosylaminopyrimidine deaminase/5-amino-6-(5-phosphoribosylamino)uracil reductase RibD [bacterium]
MADPFASDTRDEAPMAEALALARATARRTWPNPPVGAVVVRDGEVVGRGAHAGAGSPHAEPLALADAGAAARGATLYVTLEPCNHQGRTPPCAAAVYEAGIARVVVAMRDPNPQVTGGGCRWLRDRGLAVDVGVGAAEALELVWPFAAGGGFPRPWIELKTATTLDGRFAPPDTTRDAAAPFFLTGPDARRDVHRRRRRVDVVLVGEGTVRADRPRLDGRGAAGQNDVPQAEPLAAYCDTDLSWTGGFARETYLVLAGEQAAADAARVAAITADGGKVVACRTSDGRLDLPDVLRKFAARDLVTVMVEGGPRLAASFLGAGLVDRWLRYEAPRVLGAGIGWPADLAPGAEDFHVTRIERHGDDLLTILDRRDFRSLLTEVTA